jgi:SNF2 family DNA or RNA helicase
MIKTALEDPRALIVINYEALRSHSRLAPYGSVRLKKCPECGGEDETVKPSQCHSHRKELNDTGVLRTVVLDEATALADPKAQQTRAAWAICHDPSVTRRIAMTGTPISNHPGNLWGIMHAVDREEYPVRTAWIERYCQNSWNAFGGMDIIGLRPDTRDEFYSFFDPRYRRITKADAIPWLPPRSRSVRYAPIPPKMRKAYDEMESQMISRLADGTIVFTDNNLTNSIRLLQLSSAYGTVEGDRYVMTDNPSPKLDVLDEILGEMEGRQVIVAAMSKQLINLAAKRLEARGETFGLITGDQHEIERKRYLDEFQSGKRRVMLFTVAAGGVGLTMTAADTIVFLQRSWSLKDNLQAEDRNYRIGSEIHEAIHIIDVIAPDTIEEWQIHKLHEKFQRLEEIRRDGLPETAVEDDLRSAA